MSWDRKIFQTNFFPNFGSNTVDPFLRHNDSLWGNFVHQGSYSVFYVSFCTLRREYMAKTAYISSFMLDNWNEILRKELWLLKDTENDTKQLKKTQKHKHILKIQWCIKFHLFKMDIHNSSFFLATTFQFALLLNLMSFL